MARRYTAQSIGTHKSPAGKTERSSGAGSGAQLIQASQYKAPDSIGLSDTKIKAIGGLLGYLKSKANKNATTWGEEVPPETGWTYRAISPTGEVLYQGTAPQQDISKYGDDTVYDAVKFGKDEDGNETIIDQFRPREGTLGYVDANGQRTSERTNLPWGWNTANGGIKSGYQPITAQQETSWTSYLNPFNWGGLFQ